MRAFCDLLPWIAAHWMPSFSSWSARRLAPCLVRVKTSVCGVASLAQQVAQHGALVALLHQVHAVLDQFGRRVARRDFDGERIAQQAVRQRADLLGERRREQQVLPIGRQRGQHAADVADEAHVEHAVRLVEHQVAHLGEVDRALVDVVEQAARRGDDDVHALAQRVDLRPRADAAEDQDGALVQVAAEVLERLAHLGGEFAGRHQHQQARCARTARVRLILGEALQQRQCKRRRLAGAGLGGGEQVATVVHGGNGALLDGRRGDVAQFLDGAQEVGRQAELIK